MLTYELRKMSKAQVRSVVTREGVALEAAISKVRPIVLAVRAEGDVAVRRYAKILDGFRSGPLTLPRARLRSARRRLPAELLIALETSRSRIESFHSRQGVRPFEYDDPCGVLGQRVVPLRRIGVYVPGGTADYVSSVLMACVPAKIAGVREIAMCTPGRQGRVPDSILAAADMCGVDEVHPVGGAHAIAAMAYGTESIPKVQKIVGPGGAFVTAAKMLVRNDCGIDFIAGPSEVLIVADGNAEPDLLASDMLAQLEHDPLARAVLVTNSEEIAHRAAGVLKHMLATAERSSIARKASRKGAIFIIARDISEAVAFSNLYAPEHLLIDVRAPKELLGKIENAGSVFLGRHSSVAFGDYCSGTNHILPTKGAASAMSSLSVYDFLKIIPYQSISPDGAVKLSKVVYVLARSEGLPAHADAALARARKVKK
ncbi:MAG: histidinol dehydrogenase [Thermoplasmata archaeon]